LETVISTSQLQLHHVGVEQLLGLFDSPQASSINDECDFLNPYRVLVDDDELLARRVSQVERDPTSNKWLVRFIVLKETKIVIGSTSFHGPPNDEGVRELGIELRDSFRARGLGSEAVRGMWTWAVTQSEVTTLRYTVSRRNVASVKLIANMRFDRVGQQADDENGPKDIFELSVDEFRRINSG
jgi:RimJ/RimL family protein N-acetyltransferase